MNSLKISMEKFGITSIFVILCVMSSSFAHAQEDGKTLFRQNCMSCHSIEQNLVGPALKGVTQRRDSAWLYSFIKNSQEMIQAGDPIAVELFNKFNKVPMPGHPNLSNDQIGIILAYVESTAMETATSTAAKHEIERPDEFYGANFRQFSFSDFIFWIPMTITIILMIVALVAFTHVNDTLKSAKKETVVPQEEL